MVILNLHSPTTFEGYQYARRFGPHSKTKPPKISSSGPGDGSSRPFSPSLSIQKELLTLKYAVFFLTGFIRERLRGLPLLRRLHGLLCLVAAAVSSTATSWFPPRSRAGLNLSLEEREGGGKRHGRGCK